MTKQKLSLVAAGALLSVALASCTESDDVDVARPEAPVASSFMGTGGSELATGMQQLGYQLALLDRELIEDEFNQTDRDEIVAILGEMEMIGSSLQATDAGEFHEFLQSDMPAFIARVREARLAAEASPPRYYLAGRLAGGCVNCHQTNR